MARIDASTEGPSGDPLNQTSKALQAKVPDARFTRPGGLAPLPARVVVREAALERACNDAPVRNALLKAKTNSGWTDATGVLGKVGHKVQKWIGTRREEQQIRNFAEFVLNGGGNEAATPPEPLEGGWKRYRRLVGEHPAILDVQFDGAGQMTSLRAAPKDKQAKVSSEDDSPRGPAADTPVNAPAGPQRRAIGYEHVSNRQIRAWMKHGLAQPTPNWNELFGEARPATSKKPGKAAIHDSELQPDRETVRVHPHRIVLTRRPPTDAQRHQLAALREAVLAGEVGKWVISSNGSLVMGLEKVADPDGTLRKSGHPTFVGGSNVARARISGEIYTKDDGKLVVYINRDSGRYSEYDDLYEHHLANVAERMVDAGFVVEYEWLDREAIELARKTKSAKNKAKAAASQPAPSAPAEPTAGTQTAEPLTLS